MLLEGDVIESVCSLLTNKGYTIKQRLTVADHGDDIIAEKKRNKTRRILIEAKGETSSSKTSNRYGKSFSSSQVSVHVSKAFYKAAEVISKSYIGFEVKAGIALPDNKQHRDCVEKIQTALTLLNIAVFWVKGNGDVEVMSPWEL